MIRWIEPFTYQPGKTFRVMPIGTFKRGDRTLTITKDDLQQMAANLQTGRPRWNVPIYFGHPTAEQPDPPKVGNLKRLEVRDDGLYAEPEYTDRGQASVEAGEYQFVSPGVLWSKNGSAYIDEQGRQFDNVIEHVALTNRPFFGQHVALFSADGVLERLHMDESYPPGYKGHRLLDALETVSNISEQVEDVEELSGPLEIARNALKDALGKFLAMFSSESRTDKFAVWTNAFMNDLPDANFLYIEPGGEKDEDGKTKPRNLRHFPYKDASGKVDLPHLRNALARIGQSNLPAEVKQRVIVKARRIAEGTGEIEVSEKSSIHTQERDDMSKPSDVSTPQPSGGRTPPAQADAFTVTADEFAALKAKADQVESLAAQLKKSGEQVDQLSADLIAERRARQLALMVDRAEKFVALSIQPDELGGKLLELKEAKSELFDYFIGLLETADKQLTQADLFGQVSNSRAAENADTFEAAIEQELKEKFSGDRSKYAEAMHAVSARRPELAAVYQQQTSRTRGG